jgi:hypothetical protein
MVHVFLARLANGPFGSKVALLITNDFMISGPVQIKKAYARGLDFYPGLFLFCHFFCYFLQTIASVIIIL